MPFILRHPSEPATVAEYGYDASTGIHVRVRQGDKVRFFTPLQSCYNHREPVRSALWFLAEVGFFAAEDVDEVLAAREDPLRVPRRLRRAAEVARNLSDAVG